MLPGIDGRASGEASWEQRLLRKAARSRGTLRPETQELKFTLHRKLLEKINLEALATIDNQKVRQEVRQALVTVIDAEPTLLSSAEKQQISQRLTESYQAEKDPLIRMEIIRTLGRYPGPAKAAP